MQEILIIDLKVQSQIILMISNKCILDNKTLKIDQLIKM